MLTLPLFIEVSVPSQESELSCVCVLGVSILPLSTIFLFDFGTVPTMWFCFVFNFIGTPIPCYQKLTPLFKEIFHHIEFEHMKKCRC